MVNIIERGKFIFAAPNFQVYKHIQLERFSCTNVENIDSDATVEVR